MNLNYLSVIGKIETSMSTKKVTSSFNFGGEPFAFYTHRKHPLKHSKTHGAPTSAWAETSAGFAIIRDNKHLHA